MRKRCTFSLRKKILLIFIVFLLFPLLATGVLIHKRYREYFLEKEISLSSQKINELSNRINERLFQIEQLSFDICYNDTVQNIFTDFRPDRFIGSRVEYQYFQKQFGINRLDNTNIFYIKAANLKKEIAFSVGTTFREESDFDNVFLEQPDQKTLWCLPRSVETFQNTKIKIVSYYQRMIDTHTQNSMGIVRIDILENSFLELLSEFNFLSESNILLINADGDIISNTDKSQKAGNVSILYELDVNHIFSSNQTDYPFQIMDNSYYVLPGEKLANGWKLLCIIPSSTIEQQAFAIRQYVYIVGLIGILFVLLLVLLFSFIITRPLNELIALTKKIESGDLNAKSNIVTNDEFGVLSTSFNKMTSNVIGLIEANAEIRRQETISELLYLQSQINPHFLYNTLDSIRWTARRNKDFQVSEQIELLSGLFRYYLNKQGEYIRFADEIEHIKTYMAIQKFRFKDKLSYEIKFEHEIYDLYTLKLILQPLVENSIIHGFENKLDTGHLKITGWIKEDFLFILVEDDGSGADAEEINFEINQNTTNTGNTFALKNINARLKLHYGNEYGMKFDSAPGRGTCVSLKLPVLRIIPDMQQDKKRTGL